MSFAPVHETMLRVAADHPALAGHFPGRPIVPGVLLLERVIAAAEQWLQRPLHVASLPQAKFLAPLLPEETAQLRLRIDGGELRFTLIRNAETIAQGMLELVGGERA